MHLVDLDQAKNGDKINSNVIKDIVSKTSLKVQVGGGIKTREDVLYYLSLGVNRVIISSLAITDFDLVAQLISEFNEKIIVSVDVLNSEVFYKGWLSNSKIIIYDLCERLVSSGLKTLIVTDIYRDGMMNGIDITLYKKLKKLYPIEIIAAGGISTDEDVRKLNEIGINGAIIGKALYINTIKLDEVI